MDFKVLTASWRLASAGCTSGFYGELTDSVFEHLYCSVAGPGDGSMTEPERQSVVELNHALIRVAVDTTVPGLSDDARTKLVNRIAAAKATEHVTEGEWSFKVDWGQLAPNIMGVSADRDWHTVTREHQRRFCEN